MSALSTGPIPVGRRRLLPRARSSGAGMLGGAVIGILVLVALAAPLLAPHDPNAVDLSGGLQPVGSAGHLLGTDSAGRDVLSRLIYGTRLSLLGPLFVVGISALIGVPLGLLGGYVGGLVDGVLGRLWDLLLGFPPLLLAIVVVAAFGPGFFTAAIALAVVYVPLVARVVRAVILVERRKAYVDACRAQGYGGVRIAVRHALPTVAPTIVAQSTLNFGYALLDLAGLAFLGLGVQPPTADWGVMLADGRNDILLSSTQVVAASVAIAAAVVAFNLLGDRLSQRFQARV